MVGSLSYDNQPVINARIYLLTSCDDKSTATDLSGYFALSPSCMDVIKHVPADELGFLSISRRCGYRAIIMANIRLRLWL